MFDLNPIEVLKQREVSTLPPHFSTTKIADTLFLDEDIKQWVRTKLKGRFCIIRHPAINGNGGVQSATILGFENQKELTYFMLACPYLRRN